ncbi:MAG: hypothetical protein K2J80_02930, partial [Oscillospiraceae bacterium]|nr:hypothetical protein [Oscillospiraceae bacterium]
MMQFRKKILIPLLCAGVLLTTGQSTLSETAVATPDASASDAADTAPADNGGEEQGGTSAKVHITEEEALASMSKYASTSSLELYVNEETGVFAVKNLADGHYIWSNPYDAEADEYSNSNTKIAELKSALTVNSVKVTDVDAPSTKLLSGRHGTAGHG